MRFWHVCEVWQTSGGSNPLGEADSGTTTHAEGQICNFTKERIKGISNTAAALVQVESLMLYFPVGAIVKKGWTVKKISTQAGQPVDPGSFLVEALAVKHSLTGRGPQHIAASLRRI